MKTRKISLALVLIIICLSIFLTPIDANAVTLNTDIVAYAKEYLGYPYVLNTHGPNSFDCSGFVYYVFKHFGIELATSSSYYWNNSTDFGTVIPESEAIPGDIVSWDGHVGIYVGDGKCINALNPSAGVVYTKITSFNNGTQNPPHKYIRVNGVVRDATPPTVSDYADYHLDNGTEYFYFKVNDELSGVDPASVKVKVWEYGLDESAAVPCEATPTGTTDNGGYKASVDLSSKETLYFAKIVASDKEGNTSEVKINGHKPIPFFTVNKSSCTGVYLVTKDRIAVHRAPYDKINGRATYCGAAYDWYKLQVVGSYNNSYGNEWYQLSNGLWVYSDNLVKLHSIEGLIQDILDMIRDPEMYFINNQVLHGGKGPFTKSSAAAGLRAAAASSDEDIPYEEGSTIRFSTRGITPDESIYGPDSGAPLHTITFNANGGLADYESIEVYQGNTYGDFPEADRYGYAFAGWYTDPEAGERVMPYDTCTQDLDLYAHWSKQVTASGSCGSYLTWELEGDGLLKIEGSGSMTSAPWYTEGYCPNITEVSLPEGLNSIYSDAFRDSNLMSVTFPQSLTYIGNNAFGNCVRLTELDLPESITEIGSGAFSGCGITDLVIPSGVNYIGSYAFSNCKNLETLVIPDNLIELNYLIFSACTGLKEVTLPGDANYNYSNGLGPFAGCTGIEKVTYTKGQSGIVKGNYYSSYNTGTISLEAEGSLREVVFEAGITGIEADAVRGSGKTNEDGSFSACIESITLPSTLKRIGNRAFQSQDNLAELNLPEGVSEIGSSAFFAIGITDVVIPSGVNYIGSYAFSSCKNLETLVIPDNVSQLNYATFSNCTGLKEVTVPGDADYYYSNSLGPFAGCSGIEKVTYTKGQSGIVKGNYNSSYNTGTISLEAEGSLREVVFEEGITEIRADAVRGSENTEEDGSYTAGIESITLPSTLEGIGDRAFLYQDDLTELDLPEELTSIGSYAFAGCRSLSDIHFTGNAPSIQSSALSSVTATAYYPGSNTTWTENVLQNYGGNITWVDSDQPAVPLYEKTLTLPSGLKRIDSESFSGLTQGVNIVVPDTVTHIEEDAFEGSSVVIIAEPEGYVEEFCNEHGIPFHAR